jgi:hypothetical protein
MPTSEPERKKESTDEMSGIKELTLQCKVLIEKADISRVNKSGHFHVLPTAAPNEIKNEIK